MLSDGCEHQSFNVTCVFLYMTSAGNVDRRRHWPAGACHAKLDGTFGQCFGALWRNAAVNEELAFGRRGRMGREREEVARATTWEDSSSKSKASVTEAVLSACRSKRCDAGSLPFL